MKLKKWVKYLLIGILIFVGLSLAIKLLKKSMDDGLNYCINKGNSYEYCKKELYRYES